MLVQESVLCWTRGSSTQVRLGGLRFKRESGRNLGDRICLAYQCTVALNKNQGASIVACKVTCWFVLCVACSMCLIITWRRWGFSGWKARRSGLPVVLDGSQWWTCAQDHKGTLSLNPDFTMESKSINYHIIYSFC
jgi:hypothetical protein